MILTYHNIGDENHKTWVSLEAFENQMSVLKTQGFEVVKFEDYDKYNSKHIVITFDDGRKNIFDALPILQKHGFPFYVFLVGDLIGSSEEFLGEQDFDRIKEAGGILGWHTKTHADLTKLTASQIEKELKNPYGFEYLAYPHWANNDEVIKIAEKLGYKYARSGNGFAKGTDLSLDSEFVQEYTELKYVNDKIVKYIDMALFSFPCNMRCHFCYVGQYATDKERAQVQEMKYSPDDLRKALDKKRMGGTCVISFSATGETLLLPSTIEYLKAILDAGHFLHISTNLTITKHIDELLSLPEEHRSRLFFKASLQYLELKRLNLMDTFAENCHKIWDANVTCSLEIIPNDELIPFIPEIQEWCFENFGGGALPQLSIPRDETVPEVKLLSKYSLKEFTRIWEGFYSEFFRFRTHMWERPVTDFCYAGKHTCFVILNTGDMLPCSKGSVIGNFFEGEELTTKAVAKCPNEHCIIAHSWLGFGACPSVDETNYLLQRDRIMSDGKHWVSERCRNAFRQRVTDNNLLYSKEEEAALYKEAEQNFAKQSKKENSVLKEIFSIRNEYSNENKHKVLTVMGVKTKFRVGKKAENPCGCRER